MPIPSSDLETNAILTTPVEEPPFVMVIEDETTKPVEKKGINQLFEEQPETLVADNVTSTENNHVKKAVEADNSDWSLSQIPGYQQYNPTVEQPQKESKKILGFFSSQKKTKNKEKKRKSIRVLLILGLFLIFIFVIIFFALFYYDSLQRGQDDELMKFNLRTPVNNKMAMNNRTNLNNDITDNRIKNGAPESDKDSAKEGVSDANSLACLTINQLDNTKNSSKNLDKDDVSVIQKAKSPSKSVKGELKTPFKTRNKPKKTNKKSIVIKKHATNQSEKLAFDAYQRGDLVKAKRLYSDVLKEHSDNVLALSGMGAIATERGDISGAIQYYQAVLNVEPTNRLAQSALLSLRASNASESSKEKLAEGLIKNPNDPVLLFALGNHFASKKNWIEAQKQFFAASSLEPSNQNYALNLAISMDRLGRYPEALSFYKRAVSLSEIQGATFGVDSVNKRIKALSAHIQGGN